MLKSQKISALLSVVGLMTLLVGGLAILSINAHNTHAQLFPTHSPTANKSTTAKTVPSNATSNATSKPTSSNATSNKNAFTPFQGQSIKIFTVTSFGLPAQWQQIDNLGSHGWEIKAIVPRANPEGHITAYTIVLEARNATAPGS
jgi:hypothetical protein